MDPSKVSAMVEWPRLVNVKGVQNFLRFANFYRRFIRDFATYVSLLTKPTKKNTLFVWDRACKRAFESLK
jgi:hypothetical protein